MKQNKIFIVLCTLALAGIVILGFAPKDKIDDDRFVSYIIDTKKQNVELFWKDDKNEFFRSIQNLKYWLGKNKRTLLFAMNAGMYKTDNTPQGLYIENQKILFPTDTSSGAGNFYLKPNGVFFITMDNVPFICNTTQFAGSTKIKYATQSGPMLVFDGQIHPAFQKGSSNLNIRNGVGILPGSKIVFAMSKKEINFYDFAKYFKSLGCKNALYLDGLVSRTYLPAKHWIQTDGNFGVIIGVTKAAD